MSDRLPGSSWDNPIWHGKWRIYIGEPQYGAQFAWAYVHDDYDGAPDGDDGRHGFARSVDEAKAEIDDLSGGAGTDEAPSAAQVDGQVPGTNQ